ncbi:MAG: hypothetical protein WC549_05060 [Actinomycetota bacterium]
MISKITELLKKHGPLTGKELCDKTMLDELSLWRLCSSSDKIILKTFGKRFLRLDARVEGYARLSPSIKREFLTYTVIGLEKDSGKIDEITNSLYNIIRNISRQKFELAREIIKKIVGCQAEPAVITSGACFIIAGDIVYEMAHSEPRPEKSTGKLVKGSDIDIVVVNENLPESTIKDIDSAIYQEKYYLIKNPSYMEEIDYIVKDIKKVQTQLKFDTFKSMIASKILSEGEFLYGSHDIFEKIKEMLLKHKIPGKLLAIEEKAVANREKAVSYLLGSTGLLPEEQYMKLFYTKQEKEEIF